jgi:hypothetical protein
MAALAMQPASGRKFYPDDPVRSAPQPVNVDDLEYRRINDWYDYYRNTFQDPGQGNDDPGGPYPAQSVNTLGEVLNSSWYTNRTLTLPEQVRGPGDDHAPDTSGAWQIMSAKTEGVTPGFVIGDVKGRRYLLKFDPLTNPEMATAADVITAKLFYALGYNVPENYIVYFPREQLAVTGKTMFTDEFGRRRKMKDKDVTEILIRVPRVEEGPRKGMIRAVASLYVPGRPIGPFKYYGRRKGDTNDYIRHEHRRELRGLHVLAAWLNHNDSRAINSLDTIVEENGVKYVRHYLIDFGSTLGSAAVRSKSARDGNEYLYAFRPAAVQLLTLGAYVPDWARAHYPYYESVGRIQYEDFDPDAWVPNYPNRAFLNRLPDDIYWAAKKLMTISDDAIRDIVKTGQLSDKEAEAWLTKSLIERKEIIGRKYLASPVAVDNFAVSDGQLVFEHLGQKYGYTPAVEYQVKWFRFDNGSEKRTDLPGAEGRALPAAVRNAAPGSYWGAVITPANSQGMVTVYLRRTSSGHEVVGVERAW